MRSWIDKIKQYFKSILGKSPTKNIAQNKIKHSNEIEPKEVNSKIDYTFYPLESLHIKNFYGITEIDIDLPPNAPWIFLTGENGFGKTNILQAIARGLSNTNDNKTYEAIKPLADNCSITVKINDKKRTVDGKKRDKETIDLKKDTYRVMGYGTGRTSMGSESSTKVNAPATGLFEPGGLLRNIESEALSRWKNTVEHDEKYKKVVEQFKQLMPNLIDIDVDKEDFKVWYTEKDDNGNPLSRVGFEGLGSGYKSIISMIGDIILYLNDRRVKSEVIEMKNEIRAFVLIDEFELYLHPKLQKKLPLILSSLFPNVQFIASTHSPIPLLGAPKGSVFLKVNRTKEDGIQVERLDDKIFFDELLPNTLLSSPIFGMEDIFPNEFKGTKPPRIEDNYNEMKLNDLIDEKISNFLSDSKEQELIERIKNKRKS